MKPGYQVIADSMQTAALVEQAKWIPAKHVPAAEGEYLCIVKDSDTGLEHGARLLFDEDGRWRDGNGSEPDVLWWRNTEPGYQEIADSLRVCGTGGGNCDGCIYKDSEGLCSQLLKKQGAEAIESLLNLARELTVDIPREFRVL